MSEILFLAHRVPFPPNRGDKIRSHHLLKALARLGPVHVGCFSESQEDREAVSQVERVSASHCVIHRSKPLALAGVEAVLTGKPVSLTAFHSAALEKWVTRTIAERPISVIVVFSGQMGQYVPGGFLGRVVVDLCDVDSAKFEGYAEAGERVWLNAREARLLAAEEERLARRADAITLISASEAELFRSRVSAPNSVDLVVMGNGIDAEAFGKPCVTAHTSLSASSGPHFVFTGQMDYRPNERAALWAAESFMPLARERFPEAQFHVVGRNPTPALRTLHGKQGVCVWGEVPDVRPFLAAASCALVPLQIARGVQNKVLEAMAMECPVLLTPEAATGIAARDGTDWMVAPANAHAMLDRFAQLMADPRAAHTMGQAARRFVVEHHAWAAQLAPLNTLVTGKRPHQEARNAA
ncbi:MAG: TIGR03087 family PEP-CTERM/XrtA system glycosyltransferase [Pseudomonadota bacterium]